jgi:hypothetical protein
MNYDMTSPAGDTHSERCLGRRLDAYFNNPVIIDNDFRKISGDEGDRTPDLGVANAALSHLSYIPT